MMRSSVDLPPPLGPSRAVSDPVGTSSETSSSATASPKRFEMDCDLDAHAAALPCQASRSRSVSVSRVSTMSAARHRVTAPM